MVLPLHKSQTFTEPSEMSFTFDLTESIYRVSRLHTGFIRMISFKTDMGDLPCCIESSAFYSTGCFNSVINIISKLESCSSQ